MTLVEAIQRVARDFSKAREEPFKDHPLADFIRTSWQTAAMDAIHDFALPTVMAVASPGKGRWNESPWLAYLDTRVTRSAQRGYYPVFLFEPGMQTCCLVLAQGADSVVEQFGQKEALRVVAQRAEALRAACPDWQAVGFDEGPFRTLSRMTTGADDTTDPWSKSVAFGKRYDLINPPSEAQLQSDLRAMLKLYDKAVRKIGTTFVEQDAATEELVDLGELPAGGVDGAVKVVRHKAEERRMRNNQLVRDAKKFHGYRCQGCGIDMAATYVGLKKPYIEAHHLRPLADAPKEGVVLSVEDLCVLCPTCHRAIHALGCPDLSDFIKHVPQALRDFHTDRTSTRSRQPINEQHPESVAD